MIIPFSSYSTTLELASSKKGLGKKISLLLAFGIPDNDGDRCGNEYTRFFINEESKNPKERLPHAHSWVVPLRPVAFGSEIIDQVFF
jgi:hypothetical protein